jgi:uroporphyrinogen-III decarboxylase
MKTPFTPQIYEHAAKLLGRTPWEVSRDRDLLFEAHRAAWLEYRHTPVVVGIDIYNLEAEAYGARVDDPGGDGIPAITRHPFDSPEALVSLEAFDPSRDGRIAMVIEVGRRLACEFPEADVRIPVAGPFSIAVNLRGINEVCLDAALHPQKLADGLWRLAGNQERFCRAVAEAGLDVAFFESAAAPPLLSPAQFHDLELPALRRVMEVAAGALGHPVPCIMGGDTVPVLEDILTTGTEYVICNVETDQLTFVEKVAAKRPGVRVRVNLDPAIVAGCNRKALKAEVDRVLKIASGYSHCLIGTGCLPYETPPENVHWIREYLDSSS